MRAVFHDLTEACCLLGALRDDVGRVVDFEVLEINRAGEQALRRTREAVVGKRLAAVFFDAAAPETARRVLMSEEPAEEEVEGSVRRMAPAGDGVVVVLRPMGEATPGRASDGSIDRALGGLAHDFNNLLTPILAYTNLGLAQVRPGEPLFEELTEIRRAAERASEKVREVQELQRAQAAGAPKQPQGPG